MVVMRKLRILNSWLIGMSDQNFRSVSPLTFIGLKSQICMHLIKNSKNQKKLTGHQKKIIPMAR